jgi:hypothetical protein
MRVGSQSGFSAIISDHAGTEILAYLLDLQFGGIPIDIMATGMQTDWRSHDKCLRNQSNRQLRQQRACAYRAGRRKANSRLIPSAVIPSLALQRRGFHALACHRQPVRRQLSVVADSAAPLMHRTHNSSRKRPGQPYVRRQILNEHRDGKRSYHQFVCSTFTHDLEAAFGRIVGDDEHPCLRGGVP